MTPANARRHLGILASDGRVEVSVRMRRGKGRPEKLYCLSIRSTGDNLTALAETLLEEIPPSQQEERMRTIGRKILTALTGQVKPRSQPLLQRLNEVVRLLNQMRYQARWEAGPQGPRLILGHCPYRSLVDSHPEICRMDEALLEAALGENVLRTAKLESGADGLSFCVFVVR